MACERTGIPTATFVTDSFAAYAKVLCKMQGLETTPLLVLQHPVASRPESEVKDNVKALYAFIRGALLKGPNE